MAEKPTTVVSARPLVVDLPAEIKAAVRRHAYDIEVPPFRPAELAVMAWVCCTKYDGIITEEQIFKWVVMKFKYYSHLAVQDAYNVNRYKKRKRERRVPLLQKLFDAIATEVTLHEVPMFPVWTETDSDDSDSSLAGSKTYVSTPEKARTFLRRALGNETKDFKRFLDLPAEIRLMIYTEVFSYDGKIEFTNPMLHLPAPRRAIRNTAYDTKPLYAQGFDDGESRWSLPEERETVTGLSGEIMSLLLANRQIFQEAMPIFYNINTFQVTGIQELSRVLRLCGARRRVCFTRITFEHHYLGSRELTKKAFNMLGGVKQLQYFEVRAHDRELPLGPPGMTDMYPERRRWIEMLCDIKCLSLEVTGDCPKIKAYMQEYRDKKACANQQAEAEKEKSVKPSKRSKRVFKSEAIIHDD